MNGEVKRRAWLDEFGNWVQRFLEAVAEARIPPGKMQLVPHQGTINLVTGAFGIALYTAAGFVNAAGRSTSLAGQFTMAAIGGALLFVAAVVVILTSRTNLVENWNKTASVFIVVWLLALVVFLLLTYPLLLISDRYILLDHMAYAASDFLFAERAAWRDDLVKSLICTFGASLILIIRTKRTDPTFSLKAIEPWVWLVLMTTVVGLIFDTSLYRLSTL